MTVTINLSPAEEARLQQESAMRGQSVDTVAQEMLSARLQAEGMSAPYDPAAAIAVLDSFMEQDEAEHKDTMAILRRALDEDRPGQRRLFGAAMYLADESGSLTYSELLTRN